MKKIVRLSFLGLLGFLLVFGESCQQNPYRANSHGSNYKQRKKLVKSQFRRASKGRD
jgi:hypothetical protein